MIQKEFWSDEFNKENLAYLAGLIDGEGWVSIGCKVHQANVTLNFANTNKEMVEFVKSLFGWNQLETRNTKNKTIYVIRWSNWKAAKIAKLILPYVINKKEQCKLIIEFTETIRKQKGGHKFTPPEIVEKRKEIYDRLKGLNHGK